MLEASLSPRERARLDGRELDALQDALGYHFDDEGLLDEALCHSSFSNEHGMSMSNERLEFLGDSVLGFAVARALFRTCPGATEGELTRKRAELVCGTSLARLATRLRVPELLLCGRSIRAGAVPASLCEDAIEALFGAICLDGGIEAAASVVERLLLRELEAQSVTIDPKSRLQMWLQARGLPLPRYELISVTGPSHAPSFDVRIRAQGVEHVASGSSRKEAEHAAAGMALEALVASEGPR